MSPGLARDLGYISTSHKFPWEEKYERYHR